MALTVKQMSTFSVPDDPHSLKLALFLAESAAKNSMPDGPKNINILGCVPDEKKPGHSLLTIEVELAAA